jgi:hypothetical protein
MDELRLGDQLVRYDHDATVTAYREVPSGDAERCGCLYCRNFAAQRDLVYPQAFRALLDQLGIDLHKEGEAYEMGPAGEEFRLYGGWFYFVGELIEKGERQTELAQDFQCYFAPRTSLPSADACFGNRVAAIEFVTKAPWVLDESPG